MQQSLDLLKDLDIAERGFEWDMSPHQKKRREMFGNSRAVTV